jgi:hypothetical protein
MNLAQEIQSQLVGLPADAQMEILEFVQFVKYRRSIAKPVAPLFPPSRLEDVAGCLHYNAPAKTVAEMDAAVAELIRREWRP